MKIAVKYLVLLFAFIAGVEVFSTKNIAEGIVAAGAFIAYAIIEVQDVKVLNMPETEEH
jgi:hypothetical protein